MGVSVCVFTYLVGISCRAIAVQLVAEVLLPGMKCARQPVVKRIMVGCQYLSTIAHNIEGHRICVRHDGLNIVF